MKRVFVLGAVMAFLLLVSGSARASSVDSDINTFGEPCYVLDDENILITNNPVFDFQSIFIGSAVCSMAGFNCVCICAYACDCALLSLDDIKVSAVPLPSALILLGSGLAGLAGFRKNRG